MTKTPLDQAHDAMASSPDDSARRLAFYEVLADAELILLLEREPRGDQIDLKETKVDGQTYVLGYDTEDRLADGAGGLAAYVTLPGRGIARMLADAGLGLALNIDVAPSAILIPNMALVWLCDTLDHEPMETEERLIEIAPPVGMPQQVHDALHRKLSRAAGLADQVWLASATYSNGGRGHVLAFVGAGPSAETALAHAASEALTFSGIEAGRLDVLFLAPDHAMVPRLARVGHPIELPAPQAPASPRPVVPGSDPDRPPKLR